MDSHGSQVRQPPQPYRHRCLALRRIVVCCVAWWCAALRCRALRCGALQGGVGVAIRAAGRCDASGARAAGMHAQTVSAGVYD